MGGIVVCRPSSGWMAQFILRCPLKTDRPPAMPLDAAPENDRQPARNVLGGPLAVCSLEPMTGFYRNGCCATGPDDHGRHVVCAVMTAEFLAFSKERGNDLSTPLPRYQFPGLKPDDRWCLCVLRWREALEAGKAPRVVLEATHANALLHVALADLKRHAVDVAP